MIISESESLVVLRLAPPAVYNTNQFLTARHKSESTYYYLVSFASR